MYPLRKDRQCSSALDRLDLVAPSAVHPDPPAKLGQRPPWPRRPTAPVAAPPPPGLGGRRGQQQQGQEQAQGEVLHLGVRKVEWTRTELEEDLEEIGFWRRWKNLLLEIPETTILDLGGKEGGDLLLPVYVLTW